MLYNLSRVCLLSQTVPKWSRMPNCLLQNIKQFSTDNQTPAIESETETFASLLRNSKLIQVGNPVGKTVVGKIRHETKDDLYIDFGHKFMCVCPKPRDDRGQYLRGTEVKLKIKSLELSERFLGHNSDISLLEADCVLLGLNK